MKNRRSFLRTTAAAGSAIPLFSIGKPGISANEKLNYANFGAYGKGRTDIALMVRSEEVNLTAVAEIDEGRIGKLRQNHPGIKIYSDWRELLEKEGDSLDMVGVSTPDHMHAPMGVSAMNMGLHVFGQKPLAHTLHETRCMAKIAKQKGVVTQLGTQLTSSTYERLTAAMIQDGVIGKVKEVHMFSGKTWGDPTPLPDRTDPVPAGVDWDQWLGVAEKRPYISEYYHPGQWRKRLDFGTGTLGDMGCHIYSPMFQALGVRYPLSVKSVGGKPNATNWALNEKFEYIFPGNDYTAGNTVKVTWYDGTQLPRDKFKNTFEGKMPGQGSIFIGTEGILLQPHMKLPVPYPREKYAEYRYPKLEPRNHYGDFIAAIKGEKIKPLADFYDYGGPLTETVLLGALSSHFPGQTLEWDVKNLRFKNNEEANKLITKTYRKGWEVEGLS